MNNEIKVMDLKHEYDPAFRPSKKYLESMPDIQNGDYQSDIAIERVGIHNFSIPLKVVQKDGNCQDVKASITGMVSLEANKAGINMSRILRTVYKMGEANDALLSVDYLCNILEHYKMDLDTFAAHIIMKFPYRMWQESLKSYKEDGTKNGGWQYYDVTFDVDLDRNGKFTKIMWVDFVYSSACPCSTALSEHVALSRGLYGIPHSQRSVARVGVVFDKNIWIEDMIFNLRKCLTTETLVFCKREDEQDFAVKNGADPKFVEDAIRRIAGCVIKIPGVLDYKIICSHLESLHSHDAIAVNVKGIDGGFSPNVSFEDLQSLKV